MSSYTMNQHTFTTGVELLVDSDEIDRTVMMYVTYGSANWMGYGFNGSVPGTGFPIQMLPSGTPWTGTLPPPTVVTLPAGVQLSISGYGGAAVLYVVTKNYINR